MIGHSNSHLRKPVNGRDGKQHNRRQSFASSASDSVSTISTGRSSRSRTPPIRHEANPSKSALDERGEHSRRAPPRISRSPSPQARRSRRRSASPSRSRRASPDHEHFRRRQSRSPSAVRDVQHSYRRPRSHSQEATRQQRVRSPVQLVKPASDRHRSLSPYSRRLALSRNSDAPG